MRALLAILSSIFILALAGCEQGRTPAPATAEPAAPVAISGPWTLDTTASRIAFASIKAGDLAETHFFPGLRGEITAAGLASVLVPLDQVETKIDLRNERMRELFFETATYPDATIRAQIDASAYADLAIGARRQTEIAGTLSLHGVDAEIYAEAYVTRIAETRIEVASAEPVMLHVSDFGLEAGLEALREIAGLPSITPVVPVTFSFVFETQG